MRVGISRVVVLARWWFWVVVAYNRIPRPQEREGVVGCGWVNVSGILGYFFANCFLTVSSSAEVTYWSIPAQQEGEGVHFDILVVQSILFQ
jgi:hypothetical protein